MLTYLVRRVLKRLHWGWWGRCRRSWGGGGKWDRSPGMQLIPAPAMLCRIFIRPLWRNFRLVLFVLFPPSTARGCPALCFIILTSISLEAVCEVGSTRERRGKGEGVEGDRVGRGGRAVDNSILTGSKEGAGQPCWTSHRIALAASDYGAVGEAWVKKKVLTRMRREMREDAPWWFMLILWINIYGLIGHSLIWLISFNVINLLHHDSKNIENRAWFDMY